MSIDINIGSKLDAKGFKQAETATEKLTKSVKNLAGNLGLAFGTAAVVAYGKASVKAALESQAEQERLTNILRVTTGATQAQIDVLNEQANALERIGVVTGGNIKMTQSQLATFDLQISTIKTLTPAILDYVTAEKGATASASDFKSMTNGLAQALNGNFTSLTRTGFVLDEYTKKTIKEGTETERAAALVKVLNSTYKDFNANLRNTDSGKMQVLANTAREVQTIIGTGIIDSLKILSEDTTIDGLTEKMKSLATATSNASVGFSLMLKDIKDELSRDPILGPFFGWLLEDMTTGLLPLDAAINRGKERQQQLSYNKNEHKAKQQILAIDNKADKLTKSQLAAQKKLLSTQQKIAAEKKKQEILDKASLVLAQGQKVFDEEGIQLAAAAQGKLTEEERTRLALKTDIFNLEAAINEGNVTAAAKLANSMVLNAQRLAALRTDMIGLNDIQNPFTGWLETLKQMALELSKLANIKPVAITQEQQLANVLSFGNALKSKQQGLLDRTDPNADPLTALRLTAENLKAQQQGLLQSIGGTYAQSSMTGGGGTIVNLTVQGSVTTERDLVSAITQGLYSQQASGTPVNYSTVY
jgi:hypothetical protein